ncbi:hypothetical protein PHLCEN_2v10123 [Hermanssonia centrifuga]|uniref:AAA+ ATPase domain-containing protein n=1 Tax=Hermanssonia centrifuga TaxID=98765 RepID=A0A2R6NP25_9APHY|nr:hypothetical protein PHLCEN_2v10123 [Hermanssonia centrifuga]
MNLHITLHPFSQHKAAYASPAGPPVEPTLALYCPIEGGDYIIDETIRELGRQAGAEVVVLDSVQLAAGECGHFGKAASVLQLPNNPLHFAPPPTIASRAAQHAAMVEEEEEEDESQYSSPSQLTLHVLAPAFARSGRTLVAAPRRPSSPSMAKLKAFFDELINVSYPVPEGSTESSPRAPRIIYIRDFPTLAASSAIWYPALLASVRARRQGPLARQSSPVYNPTTLVFGITPSIVSQTSNPPTGSSDSRGLLSYLMSRHSGQGVMSSKPSKSEYSEDEAAETARERRLRDRLRKWEKGSHTLYDELPRLLTSSESEESGNSSGGPDIMVVGAPDGMPGLPPSLAQALGARMSARPSSRSSEGERGSSRFFRTSIIVPSVRSLLHEKACRIDRRREINELTIRMGVATVGGVLGKMEIRPDDPQYLEEGNEPDASVWRMWEDWGKTVEMWSNVRKIADRIVGKAVAANAKNASASSKASKLTLDPTPVTWDAVYEAWSVHKAARDMRKAWIQLSSGKAVQEQDEDKVKEAEVSVDEVVERVKRDPDLDQHEQRLIGCIVDTASISTTFNHVHLPARTIDSVRTIVSLPLLHPTAFQHGILKEHSMTGCLLFGPPGTGKTLVVRALAKEAGCRMLAISPSDVMDMYVGEGEKLVRSVFSLARRLAPCVVFIDEIDALFGARMGARESGGAIAHRGVITQFMQEMDGLKSSKDENIMVIGATNRPFDLDDAVLRRLPRRLLVDLPGKGEREEIIKILLRDEQLAADVDLTALAHQTESFSGSDLKHLCVSAALDAVKEGVEVPWRPSKAPIELSTLEVAAIPDLASNATVDASPSSQSEEETTVEPQQDASPKTDSVENSSDALTTPSPTQPPRTLHWRNFTAALKEITPSSSETLGSLSELRKWNNEFGEGRAERKKQVWGKGRFGFTVQTLNGEEGKVQATPLPSSEHSGAPIP